MLDYMIPAAVQSPHKEDVVLYSWLWKDPHVFIKYWIVIRLGVFQLPAYNLSVQPRIQLPAYNLSVPYRSNFLLTTWVFCLRWSNNPAAKWLINRLKLLLAIIDLPSNPKKIDHKGLQCIFRHNDHHHTVVCHSLKIANNVIYDNSLRNSTLWIDGQSVHQWAYLWWSGITFGGPKKYAITKKLSLNHDFTK